MLLIQLALISALPYISIFMSVSMEKLLHTRLGGEFVAHPHSEHCRYREDFYAQGRYCGGSQGINLPCHGTAPPNTLPVSACPSPGPAGLHKPTAHMTFTAHGLYKQEEPQVYLLVCINPYLWSWQTLKYLLLQITWEVRKWYYSFRKGKLRCEGSWNAQGFQMLGSKVPSHRT